MPGVFRMQGISNKYRSILGWKGRGGQRKLERRPRGFFFSRPQLRFKPGVVYWCTYLCTAVDETYLCAAVHLGTRLLQNLGTWRILTRKCASVLVGWFVTLCDKKRGTATEGGQEVSQAGKVPDIGKGVSSREQTGSPSRQKQSITW